MKNCAKILPSIKTLKALFNYNPETGIITNKVNRWSAKKGQEAGSLHRFGYRNISIGRQLYKAHRIAWAIGHGAFPEDEIDHRNNRRDDNRLENLRSASKSQNCHNCLMRKDNTSQVKGVRWHSRDEKWEARIMVNRKSKNLGYFKNKESAAAAYAEASARLHGEFGRVA